MVPVKIVALFLCLVVIAECQWRTNNGNFPQSPFVKGGRRRDHPQNDNPNNGHRNWNQWPGAGGDNVDGHSDNHDHDDTGHKHILGIKMPRGNGRGVGASCGGQRYAARTHICCGGTVKRRQGMRPACCGRQVFDFVFDLCCDGRITKRTVARPFC
ncbi:uncharacterized protein LOC124144278 [Haliotis rufescens]|uniref:uncharacterized protein LOC124144278 n=1 Tax=Haliotis rufescens TaxID=6454 RepID=UPI001EAFE6A6|nr:uncharacterized protein LOC124144278 [Haliotis rufescens]